MLIIDHIQPKLEENQYLCPIMCDLIITLFDNALLRSPEFFQSNQNNDNLEFTSQGREFLAKAIQKAFLMDIPWEQAKDFNFGFARKDGYPVIAITYRDIDNLPYIIWISLTPNGTRFEMGSPKPNHIKNLDNIISEYLQIDPVDILLFMYIRNKRFMNQVQDSQRNVLDEVPKEIFGKAILYYRLNSNPNGDIENAISNLLKDLNIRES